MMMRMMVWMGVRVRMVAMWMVVVGVIGKGRVR